ncbi:hypothetical protein SAMD00019534_109670, partial [Acytostelium subglobosum LB1]|uniref:hypothetical protein n=1 Tax=Acytostelium subglobosum LB1 TaxID=1410327 RepID=UPI000644B011
PLEGDKMKYDMLSIHFDPLMALSNPHYVTLPYPKAMPLDNLHKARVLLPPNDPNYLSIRPNQTKPQPHKQSTTAAAAVTPAPPVTQPQPQSQTQPQPQTSQPPQPQLQTQTQLQPQTQRSTTNTMATVTTTTTTPTATTTTTTTMTKAKESHKVFDNIAVKFTDGPLSLLRRALQERKQIRVVIRGLRSIRGHCIGYLLGFDKHFNVILRDVEEEIIRSVPVAAATTSVTDDSGGESSNSNTSSKRQLIRDKRYYGQLFIKGDTIVSIHSYPVLQPIVR